MNRRPASSLAANPVLIGAATVLVVLVAVFLSYNANSGLPFVPTYQVQALVPDAQELVVGNDVRIGGERVGVVTGIDAEERPDGSVAARLDLKLEQALEPLPVDTKLTIRPRSTLGLKYVELQPGRDRRGVPAGSLLALEQAQPNVGFDDLFQTFDAAARNAVRDAIEPVSTGLAGRGTDLNVAFEQLRPVVRLLRPVGRNLAAADTDLPGFIRGLEATATALEPVTTQLGGLLEGASTTLGALDAETPALRRTIQGAPGTEALATGVLGRARPVLRDTAALSRELRPATAALPGAGSRIADAVDTGIPVLRRAVTLGPDLEGTLRALQRVSRDPATIPMLRGLTGVVSSLEVTLTDLQPFQLQCNYLGLWTRNGAGTISEGDANGNWFRFTPVVQLDEILQSSRPAAQLHKTTLAPPSSGECEVGNETFRPGRQIGRTAAVEPAVTEETRPPAGTPEEIAIPTVTEGP
jgi:virulence factor Mce-like protein